MHQKLFFKRRLIQAGCRNITGPAFVNYAFIPTYNLHFISRMKRTSTFVLTLLLAAGCFAAQAQTKLPPRKPVQPKGRMVSKGAATRDGAVMKDGKVVLTQNGLTNPVLQETALINGTKIKPDGTVTMTDGTSTIMKEGDYMSLTGRLTTAVMKAQQDSLAKAALLDPKGKKGKKKGR